MYTSEYIIHEDNVIVFCQELTAKPSRSAALFGQSTHDFHTLQTLLLTAVSDPAVMKNPTARTYDVHGAALSKPTCTRTYPRSNESAPDTLVPRCPNERRAALSTADYRNANGPT